MDVRDTDMIDRLLHSCVQMQDEIPVTEIPVIQEVLREYAPSHTEERAIALLRNMIVHRKGSVRTSFHRGLNVLVNLFRLGKNPHVRQHIINSANAIVYHRKQPWSHMSYQSFGTLGDYEMAYELFHDYEKAYELYISYHSYNYNRGRIIRL